MAKAINILSVCGSGTVTSSMVAAKLKDKLAQKGYAVTTTEARPTEALNLAQSGRFDVLTHTSPLPKGDYGMPVINAFACVIGVGEDKFIDEVVEAGIEKLKQKGILEKGDMIVVSGGAKWLSSLLESNKVSRKKVFKSSLFLLIKLLHSNYAV